MQITSHHYGVTRDGKNITCYVMKNIHGIEARVIDYGATLTHLIVPAYDGTPTDIVLGYDDLASYEQNIPNFGSTVGRYANRIKNAAFTLNGKTYRLEANDGMNHLHGELNHRIFSSFVTNNGVHLTYESPDGEEGFPGNMTIRVTYRLDDNDILALSYEADTDQDTIINLTNHSYFNLSGHDSGKIDDQILEIAADSFLETSDDTCPTGEVLSVAGTPMDFRNARRIGDGFPMNTEQMMMVHGYDHCFLLNPDTTPSVVAISPRTGIMMTLVTTQPAVQFYSGNYLDQAELPGKGGAKYIQRGGFAVETQHFPCSPSYPQFPSTVLHTGETYSHSTLLQFTTVPVKEAHKGDTD